jgi:hypothetical protein
MNLKKRMLIKLGILISLMVVNVVAATPGSFCTIQVRFSTIGATLYSSGGRVSADGRLCIPNFQVSPQSPFAYLNNGSPCNTIRGVQYVTITNCPN